MSRVLVWSLLLLRVFSADAFAQTSEAGCNTREATLRCTGSACELVLELVGTPGCRLRIDDEWLRAQNEPRISENTSLTVRIIGANLLRYALQFETKEKVVDSYVDLAKLWREVLRFLPDAETGASDARTDGFIKAIHTWRKGLVRHEAELSAVVAGYKQVTLTCGDREAIAKHAATVPDRLAKLETLRQIAENAIPETNDLAVFAVYDATLALHEATVSRIKAFERKARASAEGFVHRITFGGAGRIVTLTITMADLASGADAGVTESVEFFVHSTMPVAFHAGYAYSSLDNFEFEPIASLAGQDLFARINEAKSTSSFVAFLSYRLGTPEARHSVAEWFATIGTDFNEPGKRIFLGATGRVKKVLLSFGIATAAVREANAGDQVPDIVDAAVDIVGTRELFTRIRTTRQWRPFVAVSFAPF